MGTEAQGRKTERRGGDRKAGSREAGTGHRPGNKGELRVLLGLQV